MLNPDYRDILSAFVDEKVEFLLVGAYALAVHGLPRSTGDIDLWVNASPANAQRTMRALERFGAPLDQVSLEDFSAPHSVVQIGVAPRRIDVMTSLDGLSFATSWPRRLEVDVDGIRIPVLSRADQATNKRAVGRPQDLVDAAWLDERVDP